MSKKEKKNIIELDSSSDDYSDNSSKLSTDSSSSLTSSSYGISSGDDISSDKSSRIDVKDIKQINDKFNKLEIELTICRKNIADMSRRIFDLEDESNNIKISNIDILQKLEEQKKIIDKQKTLHFISRRNDFF